MAALPLPARLLCLVMASLAAPAPGRIPKVYNALITSNQNLEPSKAYPVYQPVLHDTLAFPFQPAVFYGDLPLPNGLVPAAPIPPKSIPQQPPQAAVTPQLPGPPHQPVLPQEPVPPQAILPPLAAGPPQAAAQPQPQPPPAEPSQQADAPQQPAPSSPPNPEQAPAGDTTPAPPLPPNTQSPIPLNEFGLPPQVLPLGRIDPAYNGFNQVGPFTYTYPSFRYYDPFDPFSFHPYSNLAPLYRPLPNLLEPSLPVVPAAKTVAPAAASSGGQVAPGQVPPPEPNDLNLLNYSSKDPAIPNVPPPPLPDGGLKTE